MKIQKRTRKEQETTISSDLLLALDEITLTKTQYFDAIHLIDVIRTKQKQDKLILTDYVHLSKTFLSKMFGCTKYYKWVNKLVDGDIIKRNDDYIFDMSGKDKGVCKGYRVNCLLLNKEVKKVRYSTLQVPTNGNTILSPVAPIQELDTIQSIPSHIIPNDKLKRKSLVINDMKSLTINIKRLTDAMNTKIESISIENYNINSDIKQSNWITYLFEGKKHQGLMIKAQTIAQEEQLDFIQDGQKYRIIDKDVFIDEKKKSIYNNYTNAIDKLKNKNYFASRNETNNRLDTNLTSLPSVLKKVILEDNNLVSLDLGNSQFALLSYLLQDKLTSSDFNRFKEHSSKGELYEHLMETLDISKRKDAKIRCFELLFSGTRLTPEKKQLQEEFPSVFEFVNSYKKKYGDNQFAIMLQKVESFLFIDFMYPLIREKVDFVLSVHDSFIIKKEDLEIVQSIIKTFFAHINLDACLVVEY